MDEPLIYTSKGNVPEASLRYEQGWVNDGDILWHHQQWFLGDEMVKNNVHGIKMPDVTIARLFRKWFGMFRRKVVSLRGQSVSTQGGTL